MSANIMQPVVIILAMQGDAKPIQACLEQARRDGLHAVVITSPVAAERLAASGVELHARLVTVGSFPIGRVRGGARRLLMKAGTAVASLLYRVTRAARHRLTLPGSADSMLEKVGTVGRRVFPASAQTLSDRVVEPVLRIVAFVSTKSTHLAAVNREVRIVVRDRTAVGVACLDDASLLPGWFVARKYPMLPVVAGYPGRWDMDAERDRELFERGDTW